MELNWPIRILVVEDEEPVAKILSIFLSKKFKASVETACSIDSAKSKIDAGDFDIITLDYQLPDGNGLELLEEISRQDAPPRVIMVTGHGDEQVAVKSFELGASSYVVKDRRLKTMLSDSIEKVLTDLTLEMTSESLRETENRYRRLLETVLEGVWMIDTGANTVYASEATAGMLGYESGDELLGRSLLDFVSVEDRPRMERRLEERRSGIRERYELRLLRRDGSEIWAIVSAAPIVDTEGNYRGALAALTDITERKRIERELGESEYRYRTIVENAMEYIWTLDTEGRYTFVNPYTARTTGVDLLGKHYSLLVDPDDLPRIERVNEDSLSGKPQEYDARAHDKDGRWYDLSVRTVPLYSEGALTGTVSFARDVTEQKSAEEKLNTLNRHLENIIEFLPDATFIIDENRRITAWNRAMEEMSGVRKEDIIGKDHQQSAVPFYGEARPYLMDLVLADNDETAARYDNVRRVGDALHAEVFTPALYGGRGAYVWAGACPLRDGDGRIIGVIESIRDITERKSVEDSLRASQHELKTIIDGSPIPQFVIGKDHKVIHWNMALEEYSGVKAGEVEGTDEQWRAFYPAKRPCLSDLLMDEDYRGLETWYPGKFVKLESPENAYGVTDFFPTLGRSGKWLYFTAIAMRDEEGEIIGAMETLQDVTETKRAEEKVLKANEELAFYAHSVSHDLKGPISATRLGLDLLKDSLTSPDELLDTDELLSAVSALMGNVDNCYSLVVALLALAESGQVPREVSVVDVGEIVRRVLETNAAAIESRKVRFEIEGDLGTVLADPTHVYQVFSNLMMNAIIHNDSPEPVVEVRGLGTVDGGGRAFMVKDNGSGFHASYLDHMFTPFFKTKAGGTVLGLAIVDKVLKVYGGRIKAYNDGGACVEFVIEDFDEEAC